MREPTPTPPEIEPAPVAVDEVGELAAISTRRLALEAAIYGILNGLAFGLLGLVLFDREAGLAGAIWSGMLFGALMFVVVAATIWHRRRKARQGRHWQHDD